MPSKSRFVLLGQRVLLLFAAYSFSRVLFFVFNYSYFGEMDVYAALRIFYFGLRFDATAIVISNILFIAMHLIPFRFFYSNGYQGGLKILFLFVNSIALFLQCMDMEFFKFQGKRTTADIFRVKGFSEDLFNVLPRMLLDFWYLVFLFILLIYGMTVLYNRIKQTTSRKWMERRYALPLTALVILIAVIGFRGGMQYRPINIMTASRYGTGKETALILNTPFTILKTMGKSTIEPLAYFSQEEAEHISPVIHHPVAGKPFRKLNVVVIVVESLGKEYVAGLIEKERTEKDVSYTPFLDSLMSHALVYTRAFANGKRSIEGIPCVAAGLPALMPEPFITSAYNGNHVSAFPFLLKQKGYFSVFFHGGTNGTMGFDNFSRLAGYDAYVGRKEYNNEKDYDGNWGIYDEPFLQYAAKEINKLTPPFHALLFTLSSHHPFPVPVQYKGMFPKGTLPIHESIAYADYSLRNFFETAKHMPWYDNTLFVITADHTAISGEPFYQNRVGMYSVPFIFYVPSDSLKGRSEMITQQLDILPSVLDYLHYDSPYFAFGKSVFDTTYSGFAVNFISDTYQLIMDDFALTMDTLKTQSLYNFVHDSTLSNNLINKLPEQQSKMERKLKAFIQNFNHVMLNDGMTITK